MRVLVTGGGGFLGAAAVRALVARGDTAIAFDTRLDSLTSARASAEGDERLIRVPGDITDMANVAGAVLVHKPDAVVHCAAIVGVLSSLGSPINVVHVNIEGSLNVFEAMRLGGIRRCIHISSEEAYGAFRSDKVDETHPLNPELPYGICKAAVEQLGRSYGALHGLEIINLRTSWVYGPGLPRDRIPKNLVDAALAGRKLHIPTGAESAIDHTYVDDVVSAILMALDHETHRHDVYNIASGSAPTVAEIVAVVRELISGAQLSVGPGAYRHGDRVEAVRKGALDVTRAAAELGWKPRYDIRSGLAVYIQAAREAQASFPRIPSRTEGATPLRGPRKEHMDSSETKRTKPMIRPAASVMWEEPPAHYGGAYSKMLVRPEPCGSKILDYRISVYQPKAYVAPHRHRIQEQIYHVLDGEGLMELEGERTVVRKDDVIFIPPGVEHAIYNTGMTDLRFIVVTSPPDE